MPLAMGTDPEDKTILTILTPFLLRAEELEVRRERRGGQNGGQDLQPDSQCRAARAERGVLPEKRAGAPAGDEAERVAAPAAGRVEAGTGKGSRQHPSR